MEIVSKAPTRIDLAGGTLDLWPLFLFHEQALTINVAINLFATAKLEPLTDSSIQIVSKDQKLEVHAKRWQELNSSTALPLHARLIRYFAPARGVRLETDTLAPAGSGLGGSSALAIAISGALNEFSGNRRNNDDLIAIARDVEAQVLGIPTGVQDYYAAVYGGLNGWQFGVNEVQRVTYSIPSIELQNRILLFFSGIPRNSGINNWQVFKNRIDGDSLVRDQLEAIRKESYHVHQGLEAHDWKTIFRAVSLEWEARKKLAPSITTETIDNLIQFGQELGAKAGKVCGAGGGGCLFLMMDPNRRKIIQESAEKQNFQLLNFEISDAGLTITPSQ